MSQGEDSAAAIAEASLDANSRRVLLLVFLKGMAMGAADVVPGVSGGTIAFITGIYERLLNAIKAFEPGLFGLWRRQGFAAVWQRVDGFFLLALFAGIATSVLSLARLLYYLLANEPLLLSAFFVGLIAASTLLILRQVPGFSLLRAGLFVVGLLAVIALGQSETTGWPQSAPWFFLAGALAICAMILPGISGSFILLLLGMYAPVIGAIKAFDLGIIALFGLGCVCGLLAFVRVLSFLLTRFRAQVLSLLCGVLLGSISILWPWKSSPESGPSSLLLPSQYAADPQLLAALGLMALGFALVYGLERAAAK